jgi:hypothetical protein
LVYANDVNTLGGSLHTTKENAQGLKVASKDTGLALNADTTKYIIMSTDQHAGRSNSLMTDNIFFEKLEQFKYWGATVTNQNPIQEEIKSRLNSGNACCHSVQNPMYSSFLSNIL